MDLDTYTIRAGHWRPVFVYQIQAEGGTLDQVVQARVDGKADVQQLLMEYCKMKKPLWRAFVYQLASMYIVLVVCVSPSTVICPFE